MVAPPTGLHGGGAIGAVGKGGNGGKLGMKGPKGTTGGKGNAVAFGGAGTAPGLTAGITDPGACCPLLVRTASLTSSLFSCPRVNILLKNHLSIDREQV